MRELSELGPIGEWQDELLALYSEGMDDVEVMSTLQVSMKAFKKLYQNSEVFAELIDYGRQLSQAHWHRLAREGTSKSKNVDSGILKMNMGNRWGWADKKEVDDKSKNPEFTPEELKRMVMEKLEALVMKPALIEHEMIDVTPNNE